MKTRVVGIAGGSGSGKTTLARKVAERLGAERSMLISQDSYYIDQSEKFTEDGGDINFDHPESLEFSLLATHLEALKSGHAVEIPRYDFASHKRLGRGETVASKEIVLVDGTLILSQPILLPHFEFSVFIQVDSSIRFERRLRRDTVERRRLPEGIKKQWDNHVAPMHETFVEPSLQHASVVVSNDDSFDRCIDDLVCRLS